MEDVRGLVHQAAIIEVADMPDGFLAALTKDGGSTRSHPMTIIDGCQLKGSPTASNIGPALALRVARSDMAVGDLFPVNACEILFIQ